MENFFSDLDVAVAALSMVAEEESSEDLRYAETLATSGGGDKAAVQCQANPKASEVPTLASMTKKSIDLLHGTLGFRTSPPSVKQIKGVTCAHTLDALRTRGFMWLIRTKEEIDKELAEAEARRKAALEEVKVSQTERDGE